MVGAIIVTHGNLASELLKSAEMILGRQENVVPIGIKLDDSEEVIVEKITKAMKEVGKGEGILVFTDMFGGTPSNLSLSFMEDNKVEVITGVNLPMLIKFFSEREKNSLSKLISFCKIYGKKHIIVASEILNQKKDEKGE
ncbi:MAG: PTS sugar transporter subunit IIA [Candidatus Schekmanbacteria bacterium]|nr:MAG: PTS sugar transporter subunit IIA [Candidatus Schekmanbacteria bacterium]